MLVFKSVTPTKIVLAYVNRPDFIKGLRAGYNVRVQKLERTITVTPKESDVPLTRANIDLIYKSAHLFKRKVEPVGLLNTVRLLSLVAAVTVVPYLAVNGAVKLAQKHTTIDKARADFNNLFDAKSEVARIHEMGGEYVNLTQRLRDDFKLLLINEGSDQIFTVYLEKANPSYTCVSRYVNANSGFPATRNFKTEKTIRENDFVVNINRWTSEATLETHKEYEYTNWVLDVKAFTAGLMAMCKKADADGGCKLM